MLSNVLKTKLAEPILTRSLSPLQLSRLAHQTTRARVHGRSQNVRWHSSHKKGGCSHSFSRTLSSKVDEFLMEEMKKDRLTLEGTHPELEDLLRKNKAWVLETNERDPEYFKRISKGQNPKYLYIGCSDAGVDPAQMMGVPHGNLFVHRNIGNIVSGTDMNFMSVLEFAVDVLQVPHIIVCGHYDCGAVRGSIAQPKSGGLGLTENWIRNIRDVARLHKDELLTIADKEQRQRRLVELNVMEQCFNIFKASCVQRKRLRTYVQDTSVFSLPRVHGLVFDVSDGLLTKLPFDFKRELEEHRKIYDLYQIPEWVKKRPEALGSADFWEGIKR